MEHITKKILGKAPGILYGSVQNHNCDPEEDCPECQGSGRCQECHGEGQTICTDCQGSGNCSACNGRGRDTCRECGGSGRCSECGGSGEIRCSICHGNGYYQNMEGKTVKCRRCNGSGWEPCRKCDNHSGATRAVLRNTIGLGIVNNKGNGKCRKCHGYGYIECNKCNGSGRCKNCNGTGKLTCKHCEGNGTCPNCNGHGRVTCTRCNGSGIYQTYLQFEATHYAKRWKFFGTSAISNLLNNAKGNLIYQNTFRKWLNANSIELDNQEEMKDTCRKYLGENKKYLFEEFWTEYEANEGLRLPNTPFDKHYAESTKIVGIPLTCIEYNLNNQNYKLYIIGNNTLVAYDEVPSNIEAFKLNFKEKLRMALTEKSRLKAYATLAAYIFLCDGKSPEESKLLNCMVNELDMSDSKREKFMENIANIDTSLPYEDFRSKIKRLFKSKKTISFAWQCMAVDKQMSEQEKQLFTNICNEYDIDENEIDNLKRMASRFALLKDEEVAKEYCDIKKEFTSIKKKFWITTIIGTVSIMLGILACIFLPKIAYESTDSKSKVESVANTETETVAVVDSTSVNTSDNDMSDFDKFVDEIESWGTPAEYVKAHPLKSSDDYDKMNDIANKMYEDITNRANKMYESISADANKVYEKVSENANKQYEAKEIDYDACSKLTSDAYDKYSSIQSAAYDKYSNIQTKAYDWYSEVQSLYYDQQNGMNNN